MESPTETSSWPSTEPLKQPSTPPSIKSPTEPSSRPSTGPQKQPSTTPSIESPTEPSSWPSTEPLKQPSTTPLKESSAEPSSWPSSEPLKQPSTTPSKQSPILAPVQTPEAVLDRTLERVWTHRSSAIKSLDFSSIRVFQFFRFATRHVLNCSSTSMELLCVQRQSSPMNRWTTNLDCTTRSRTSAAVKLYRVRAESNIAV